VSSPTAGGPRIGLGAVYAVRIDPADVGRRVTLRRTLPDDEGTGDVVGALLSWSDGVLVLQRRNGDRVEVPEASVLSARVVAPEVSAADLQRRCAADWRPDESADLNGWVLRFHAGLNRRSCSALALDPPSGVPGAGTGSAALWERTLDQTRAFYGARGLAPQLLVVEGSRVDRYLDDQGLPVTLRVDVLITSLETAPDTASGAAVEIVDQPPDRMLEVNTATEQERQAMVRLLATGPGVAYARAMRDGTEVGSARVTVAEGWAGLTFLEVGEEHRRQGIARALVAAVSGHARAQGATHLWLQVEQDNHPAQQLYRAMEFTRHHGYCYRALQ
jgi:ribosomal protein S18 acetylase RimI-like enzyme